MSPRAPRKQGAGDDGEAVDLGAVALFSSAMHHEASDGSASAAAAQGLDAAEDEADVSSPAGGKRKRVGGGCPADGSALGAGQECVLFAGGSGASTAPRACQSILPGVGGTMLRAPPCPAPGTYDFS